jgi:hypothetical protein
MPLVEFDMETSLPPEKVLGMLTDFSAWRPDVWPGLWAGAYEVYSVGPTTAEVREGNKFPRVWARERYNWSTPGVVRWEVMESNFCKPGSFVEARLRPREAGGSGLRIRWNRTPSSVMGVLATAMIVLTRGAPVRASLNASLKQAEQANPGES